MNLSGDAAENCPVRKNLDIADEISSVGAILVMLALAALSRAPVAETEAPTVSATHAQQHPQISAEALRLRDGKPLRINRANENDLVLLPGVGPAKAKAIVAYRKNHGAFRNANDLTRVSGLGVRSVAKLHDLIVFE